MKKQEKIFFVSNLAEELKAAKSAILVNYAGLSVKLQQQLVRRLKEAHAKMIVVKNTLLKLAGEAAKVDPKLLEENVLTGQTALVISEEDPIAPLSVLGRFAKEFVSAAGHPVPQMKVGIVEGSFQDSEALAKLANLPAKSVLLAQILGVLASPSYRLIGTLEANTQKLLFVLREKAKGGE